MLGDEFDFVKRCGDYEGGEKVESTAYIFNIMSPVRILATILKLNHGSL